MMAGKTRLLPPYARSLGILLEEGGAGTPLFRMPFSSMVEGRAEFLHGGAIAGLLEIAAIGTLMHVLAEEEGVDIKPVNITIDFMRGGRVRETFAAATITRLGGRIANADAIAWQEDRDKIIARAHMNLLLRRGSAARIEGAKD